MSTLSALSLEQLPVSTVTGKPVLHFAHANGMPSAVYAPLFAKLAPFFTIEYIERLGTHPDYPVDNHWQRLTQQVVDSIAQVREKHGVTQVVALGHSLGALCTLQALYKVPEYVNQAVLLDPPWIYGKTSLFWHMAKVTDKLPLMNHRFMDKLSPAGTSKYRRDVWDTRDEAYAKLRHKKFFKEFDERCFQGYIEHGLDERADGKVTLAIPKAVEVEVFRTNPSWYWLTPSQAPKPPVTLVVGEDSLFLKRRFPQQVHARLGIEYDVHTGGHMFPLEYPDAVADKILSIIAKQLTAAA